MHSRKATQTCLRTILSTWLAPMKQLQSWFTNVSPHFMACLHLRRGEQAGDAGVGKRLLWIIFKEAFCSISSILREAWAVFLNRFMRLKLAGLPQILKKTMLKSEAQALHRFLIQSTFSSLLKRSPLITPLAWLIALSQLSLGFALTGTYISLKMPPLPR